MKTLSQLKKQLETIKCRIQIDTLLMEATEKEIAEAELLLTTKRKLEDPKLTEFLPHHSLTSQFARSVQRGDHDTIKQFIL